MIWEEKEKEEEIKEFQWESLLAMKKVAAVLRACFLSGTLGELLVVSGDKYNSKRMAEVLIDEAKMTRNQVVEMGSEVEEADPEEVLRSREILRWQPEISFKEGAKEVVQYFVSKVDEENRTQVCVQ